MNKKALFLIIVMAIIAVMSASLMAEEPEPEPNAESVAQSTVRIEFEEGDANVDPLDPDRPEIPGNGGTDEGGPLALNHVSQFFFDEQTVSNVREEYPTSTERPYIQVTDMRGTKAGWEVYAKASGFEDEDDNPSLQGSSISFSNASLNTTTENVDEPTPSPEFTLLTDDDTIAKVVVAEPSTGMGTWFIRWYQTPSLPINNYVKLVVPGGTSTLGQHTATITWYLTVGPIS